MLRKAACCWRDQGGHRKRSAHNAFRAWAAKLLDSWDPPNHLPTNFPAPCDGTRNQEAEIRLGTTNYSSLSFKREPSIH